MQQAISTKVDGIILDAIDCATAKPQLQKAREAGIKIVAFASYDCDDPSIGGSPLFDAQPLFAGGLKDNRAAAFAWTAMQAKFAAAKQNGKAKVILFKLDAILAAKYSREGLEQGFKSCPGCEVVDEVPLAPTDIGPKLQQKVQSALLQHPEANTVMAGFDVLLLAGVEAGVKASGRADQVMLFGAEGYAPTADLAPRRLGRRRRRGPCRLAGLGRDRHAQPRLRRREGGRLGPRLPGLGQDAQPRGVGRLSATGRLPGGLQEGMGGGLVTMHIGHVALRVTDLERSVAHVTGVLGLRERARSEGEVLLSSNEKHHELQLIAADVAGMDHIGLEAESAEELVRTSASGRSPREHGCSTRRTASPGSARRSASSGRPGWSTRSTTAWSARRCPRRPICGRGSASSGTCRSRARTRRRSSRSGATAWASASPTRPAP